MLFTKQVSAVNITVKLNNIKTALHTAPDTNILVFGNRVMLKKVEDSDVLVPCNEHEASQVLWNVDNDSLVRVQIGEHELVRTLEWVRAYALSGIAHPSWFEKEVLEALQFDTTYDDDTTVLTIKPWFDIEEEEIIDA